MFSRNLIPVWLGIILLSGMFLMGQNAWSPKSGACSGHPCLNTPNALPNSCEDVGEGQFTCDCEAGYFWEEIGNTCQDPCDPDPCDAINNALAGSCTGISADDFTCECNQGFYWSDTTNTCEKVEPPCRPDPCQDITNAIPDTCEVIPGGVCAPATDFTCNCLAGFLWDHSTNTCEAEAVDPCDSDPCLGISDAVAGSCTDVGGGDFTCECNAGFLWDEDTNTCEEQGVPAFLGGVYNMTATGIAQDPPLCLLNAFWTATINAFIRNVPPIQVYLPSGEIILANQESGNPYPLTIDLPNPLTDVDVLLSLDPTWQDILMDGPDVYVADTSGVLPFPGVDCVITGSADGIFTDINTVPLTGTLTIDITDVQASPGGACSLLWDPAGDCQMILTINAGSPIQ